MVSRLFFAAVAISALLFPALSAGAPVPLPQTEIISSPGIGGVQPHVSPAGTQLITYLQSGTAGVHLTERGSTGGQFSSPATLSTTPNSESPSISFTPDGGTYAIWGVATSGATAEQAFRPAGGSFGAAQPVVGCGRFVDSAAGPTGGIAVACSHRRASNPPDTVRFGVSPTLGPVSTLEELVPPAYDPFVRTWLSWGKDGTIAIVTRGRTTTTDPPPANETTRVRVSIRGPVITASVDLDQATWPQELSATPPTVLDDGTIAVGLNGTAARLLVRPAGPGSLFSVLPLPGTALSEVGTDASQNLHVMSADASPPDRKYWANMKSPGGDFGTPFPIPLVGSGDPYVPFNSFKVATDGTEYALITAADGVYATSRIPGQPFTDPQQLGDPASGNPATAVTPDGDLLVAWTRQDSPAQNTLVFGGLDKTPPQVRVVDFPASARTGQPVGFSATATDAMGIATAGWSFGSGQATPGEAVAHTFTRPGRHQVRFSATDAAGHRTTESRTVNVTGKSLGPDRLVLKLKVPKRIRFGAFARRGLRVAAATRPGMRLRIAIGASKRKAKLRPMAVRSVRQVKRRHVLRIKPRRARRGKARKFRLFVRVTGITSTGERVTRVRVVRVRR